MNGNAVTDSGNPTYIMGYNDEFLRLLRRRTCSRI